MSARVLLLIPAVLLTASAAFAQPKGGPPVPAAGAATSDVDDAKAPAENVPWYFPAPSEKFVPPPKPVAKRRNPPVVSASIDFHSFASTITGTATEVRAHGGIAIISGHIGAVATGAGRLLAFGAGVGRWSGLPIYGAGTGHEIKLLLPNLDARVLMDGVTFMAVAGTSLTGLRYCTCGADGGLGVPLKIELRAPTFNAWLPFGYIGKDDSYNKSAISIGASIDAGFYF